MLAGIVVLAINPTKQLAQARNTERKADVATIQRALYQYVIDGNRLPVSLTSELQDICQTGQTGDCVVLTELTSDQRYLAEYPVAPGWADTITTGYQVKLSSSGRGAEVTAVNAELGETISTPPGVEPDVGGGGGPVIAFTVAGLGNDYDGGYYDS